jgi:hypothetical protein
MNAKEQKLLEWLRRSQDGMLLESQVVASGMSRTINDLILKGLVTIDAHPSVFERTSPPVPAAAVVLTSLGRVEPALKERNNE